MTPMSLARHVTTSLWPCRNAINSRIDVANLMHANINMDVAGSPSGRAFSNDVVCLIRETGGRTSVCGVGGELLVEDQRCFRLRDSARKLYLQTASPDGLLRTAYRRRSYQLPSWVRHPRAVVLALLLLSLRKGLVAPCCLNINMGVSR